MSITVFEARVIQVCLILLAITFIIGGIAIEYGYWERTTEYAALIAYLVAVILIWLTIGIQQEIQAHKRGEWDHHIL